MASKGLQKHSVLWITMTALFLAMNIALSSFGVPVPGIGAFLGDFFFYPTPMFVSLVVHGLQAVLISVMVRRYSGTNPQRNAVLAVTLGAVIMIVGYTLGRAFIYSTPAYAVAKLPFQILQAAIGAAASIFLCYGTALKAIFDREVSLR